MTLNKFIRHGNIPIIATTTSAFVISDTTQSSLPTRLTEISKIDGKQLSLPTDVHQPGYINVYLYVTINNHISDRISSMPNNIILYGTSMPRHLQILYYLLQTMF